MNEEELRYLKSGKFRLYQVLIVFALFAWWRLDKSLAFVALIVACLLSLTAMVPLFSKKKMAKEANHKTVDFFAIYTFVVLAAAVLMVLARDGFNRPVLPFLH